jgi:hypothetical protein
MEQKNCTTFSNEDCRARYGEQAFCRDGKCFCNRQSSYVNADGKCGMLENKTKRSNNFI